MGEILERCGQRIHDLFVDEAGQAHGVEGAVGGYHAVKLSGATFLNEIGAVGSGGSDEVGERGQGVPCLVGAVKFMSMSHCVERMVGLE